MYTHIHPKDTRKKYIYIYDVILKTRFMGQLAEGSNDRQSIYLEGVRTGSSDS